jgi:hypothetical protein
MAVYGNPTGPLYLLGLVAPAVAGTPVALNQNVAETTSFGTPVGGVPGYSTSGKPAIIVANQLIFDAPSTNTKSVYVVYKGGAAAAKPNSVIKEIQPGGTFILAAPQSSNPFQLDQFLIDAAANGEGVRVTAVIL